MMVKGSCDHMLNDDHLNHQVLTMGDGTVTATITWTWDGVSVFPACDGPIVSVRVVNAGTIAWQVRTPRASKPGGRTYTIQPGQDITLQGSTLNQRGITLLSRVEDLTLIRAG